MIMRDDGHQPSRNKKPRPLKPLKPPKPRLSPAQLTTNPHRWVALRGILAAVAKALIQFYFVNFLPLPYWLMKRLPFRQPRRYGGTLGSPRSAQLARSGAAGGCASLYSAR